MCVGMVLGRLWCDGGVVVGGGVVIVMIVAMSAAGTRSRVPWRCVCVWCACVCVCVWWWWGGSRSGTAVMEMRECVVVAGVGMT